MNKQLLGLIGITLLGAGAFWLITDANKHDHSHKHSHDGHEHAHHDEADHANPSELVAKEPVRADGAFTITTSFYPLQYVLERIAGDLAIVTNLGEGQDPHDFRPTTQDIATLQQSDLVVLQGAEFEPWGHNVQEQLGGADIPVLIATDGIALREAGEDTHHDEHKEKENHNEHEGNISHDEHEEKENHDHHDHGSFDPHTWLDPVLFSEVIAHIATALATLDPENTDTYISNAESLQTDLMTLDDEYRTALASCELNETITSHDAFGYLAARYNFEIHAIGGISTQDLPSVQTLAKLRAEAEEGIEAILLEESSVTAYGQTLAAETGLETLSVNPISYVITDGEDYTSIMRTNLTAFKNALRCDE